MATIVLSYSLLFTASAEAVPSFSGESYRPVFWGPSGLSSQIIEYSVDVTSSGNSSDQGFLNVVRDDGTWVIQNLPVGFEPGVRRMATNINSSLFLDGANYQVTFSNTIQISTPLFISGSSQILGRPVNYLANNPHGGADGEPFTSPPVPPNISFTFGNLLGFSYHTGMPDLAQGLNECYPTAAANSLTWLNNTYGLGLNLTTSEIRDILKDENHMKTNLNQDGTTGADFKIGKDKFVQEKKLPIETHVILGDNNSVTPTLSNILKEMKKGQDVEIILDTGNYLHMVTLVGIFNLGSFGAGIVFNDPDDGNDQTQAAWLDSNGIFKNGTYAESTLKFAIAESVIPEPSLTFGLMTIGFLGICSAINKKKR
jgi:hypothetical protein